MEHPVYFLTACTLNRRPILSTRAVHGALMSFAGTAVNYGVFVGRYVLMPDHLHLFAGFGPNALPLSLWVKALKRSLTKELPDAGAGGRCWQKGFFDHVMRSAESYSQKWHYVRENPVRAGLVLKAEEWPYQGEIYPLEVRNL